MVVACAGKVISQPVSFTFKPRNPAAAMQPPLAAVAAPVSPLTSSELRRRRRLLCRLEALGLVVAQDKRSALLEVEPRFKRNFTLSLTCPFVAFLFLLIFTERSLLPSHSR